MTDYIPARYRYRRYRRPLRIRKYIIIAVILAAVIGMIAWYRGNVSRLVVSLGEERVRAESIEAVNGAAMQVLEWNAVDYSKMVTITRDGEGAIVSIETNAYQVNLMARQMQTLAAAQVNAMCEKGIGIPLGAFTGIEMLAGFGPTIPFQILPVGSVLCSFAWEFSSAGINQTRHALYMDAEVYVSILLPSETKKIAVNTQILVCDSVIVGKIPEIYLSGKG